MKKLTNKINFAMITTMALLAPTMASAAAGENPLCELAREFGPIFNTVRMLAFIGAGITIAGWAWGYISGGKVDIIDEVKGKGLALLVGFFLLFAIGTVLSIFISMASPDGKLGCVADFFKAS